MRVPCRRRRAPDPAVPEDPKGYIDLLAATKRKNIVHSLVEIDITHAQGIMRQREVAGEDLSFTAFLIHAVAHAVTDRIMHA